MLHRCRAAVLLLLLAAPVAAEDAFKLVVNASNPGTAIQRNTVKAIFKGEMVRWKEGDPITPVDQSVRSPVRIAFSQKVLGESVMAMQTYWQRQLVQGRRPPMAKGSDGEVVAFVKANKGAIGYVASGFAVDGSVKVIKVLE